MTTGKIIEKINERIIFLSKKEGNSEEIQALGRAKKELTGYFEQQVGSTQKLNNERRFV